MKKTLKLLSLVLCILISPSALHATDVGGIISTDITWNVAGSPYIVTASVLLNPGVTLTIEPGVIVKFNADFYIQVAGILVARGTPGARILFTSNSGTPSPGDWAGISFNNASTDAEYNAGGDYISGCILEYCIIEYAGPGVTANLSGPCIDHCVFIHNYTEDQSSGAGLKVTYSDSIRIRNNLFLSNQSWAIYGASGGIYMEMSEKVQVVNNIFYNNSAQSYNGAGGDAGGGFNLSDNPGGGPFYIAYNTFYMNTARGKDNSTYPHRVGGALIASPWLSTDVTIEYNTIIDNEGFDSDDAGGIVGVVADILNNNLINNKPYDIAINSGWSKMAGWELNAVSNWWNTAVESEIQAKIHDYYDNFQDINEVLYDPWESAFILTAPITPPAQVIKQYKPGGIYLRWKPNPETDVAGYKIYYGSPTGYSYSNVIDVGNDTVYTIPEGVTLYEEIAVTAYDATADGDDDMVQGHESWYSVADLGISIAYIPTNVSCNGFSDGAVDLIVTNGFPPFTFDWSNDSTREDLVNITAGTYLVTVTDTQGFTAEGTTVVTEPDLLEVSFGATNINCIGGSDGEIDLTVTGGTAYYSYSWTGPDLFSAFTEDITALKEGKYYLSLEDSKACSLQDSVTLTYNHELPVIAIAFADSNKICEGDTLVLDAGTGFSEYLWSTLETGQTIKVSATNTYSVTVTDVNGCVNSDDEMVTVFPVPASSFVLDDSICEDETNLITYTGSGLPEASYAWELDEGSIVSGSGQGPLTVEWPAIGSKNVSLSVIQDGCHSDTTRVSFDIFQVPTSLFTIEDAVCSDGLVAVAYNGNATGDANFNWSLDGGSIQSGSGQGPLDVNWTTGGNKTVSLEVSENGCISGITDNTVYVAYPFEDEEICLVTIDEKSGKNMVVWENTPDMGIDSYNIYRETNVSGVYTQIGNVPAAALSLFVDMVAVPEQQQYLYKISAVDTCGNESDNSQYHKTLFLQYNGADVGVNLSWKLYQIEGTPISFDSYILYKGTDSTELEPFDTISGGLDAYTDNDPNVLETRYYYRIAGVKAEECDASGGTKAGAGPYSHSISNLEDNRLQASGIRASDAFGNIKIIPNPCSESTTIRFTNPENKSYRLNIIDLSGKVVRSLEVNEPEFVLNRDNLEKGYYIIELRGDSLYRGKLIIE